MRLQFVLLGITTFVDLISADPRMLVTTIHDPRYAVLEEAPAGEGLGTVIRLVQRLSDSQILAAKFFDPSDEFQDNILRREFMFGHMFSHENIGRSIEIVEGSPTACIIMEYFPTVMLDILFTKELSTAHIDILFKQILAGVAHMHSLGIAHRDLKMDNVLLDENGNAKIIDFGRASIARDLISGDVELAYGLWGSQPFSAPECQGERKYDPILADIWSLGVLYISMILGDLPWDSATDSDEAFVRYFRRENISLAELMALIPSDSRHLISIMLNLNPHQRPNMTEVFANSWIQNIRV